MKFLLLAALLLTASYSLTARTHLSAHATEGHQSESETIPIVWEHIVGGFSDVDLNNLDSTQKQIEDFILETVPELKQWKLVGLRQQVVAGMNYCYTFEGTKTNEKGEPEVDDEEYCVWSKSWEHGFLQLTTPDGDRYIRVDQDSEEKSNESHPAD